MERGPSGLLVLSEDESEKLNSWTPEQRSALVALAKIERDEDRAEVLGWVCSHCGRLTRRCQCWNDE